MRIALFGGTFDPPHLGHLRIAAAAADTFALDQVHFAPTGRQPLKPEAPTASFADRLAMTALACDSNPTFIASSIDAPHADGSPNYTVDALATLLQQNPSAQIFSITGIDAFQTLRQWRNPDQLLQLAEWIVVSRPGIALDLAPLALTPNQLTRVHLLTGIHEDISATCLRARLRAGQNCSQLLPPDVAAYIAAHHLYQ